MSLEETIVCGCISGIVANGIVHPADSYKAQTQFLFQAKKLNLKLVPSLFQAYSFVILSTIPCTAIYFTALEFFKKQRMPFLEDYPVVKDFTTGVLTQAVASIFFTPRDVVKERMQVQHLQTQIDRTGYTSSIDCLKKLYNSDGIFGLYKGYFQTLTLWGIYGGLFLALDGRMKQFLMHQFNCDLSKPPPTEVVFASAFISASISAIITNPLDVLKLHYQVRDNQTTGWNLFSEINKEHGYRVWGKGAISRMIWVAPRTTLAFSSYDYAKRMLYPSKHSNDNTS